MSTDRALYILNMMLIDISMVKTKISMLTPYYPPVKGGISSYVLNLSSQLETAGFDVKVISYSAIKHYPLSKIYFVIKSLKDLFSFKPRILHAHSSWYTLLPSVIYSTIYTNCRLVYTFHTEAGGMNGAKKKIFEYLLSKCDYITFVSRKTMDNITSSYSIDSRKQVIYAGVSHKEVLESEVQEFRDKYGILDKAPVITFIGPLVWEKKVEGVKILIHSFKDIAKHYPSSILMIVGDGKYRLELESMINELDLSGNVVFTGFIENVFIPLSVTDIYTHISLMDGCPISLLEAMICRKPIIATNIGGIPEIIADGCNGYLVDPEQAVISAKIIELWEDNSKKELLSTESLRVIDEKFTWERIASQFTSIYCGGNT